MSYNAIIEHTPEGGYWARVRELPGCFSSGSTLEELKSNLREAISLHLEALADEPLPAGSTVIQLAV